MDYGVFYCVLMVNSMVCLIVFVDIFDVFWSENCVNYNFGISFYFMGGFIEKIVFIYLMEFNKLCDSSVMDRCGDYCWFVFGLIIFFLYGCDNVKVMVMLIE